MAFHFEENEIAQITAIITNFASVAIYILTEASVDKAAAQDKKTE